jgi:putative membrane protein insertion efficiency factor
VNFAQHILVLALRLYRAALSPILTGLFGPLGLGCRFTPTCSQYALEAVQRHGAISGTVLSVRRLCRCHPWGGCGEDPVPEAISPGRMTNDQCPMTNVQ